MILKNPTFSRTPRFDDPYANSYNFTKIAFWQIHIFLGFARCPLLVILKNPMFCRTPRFDDPYANPYYFSKTALSQNTHFPRVLHDAHFWWSWMKTLRFVELLRLMIPTPTPTIFRKLRFSNVHIFLGFGKMPILGDPENPAICSILQFDDP